MRRTLALIFVALVRRASGEALTVTEDTWEDEVTKKVEDSGKKVCEKFSVRGFPTLKYFGPGLPDDGEKYEESREYGALQKFVKLKSKPPCEPHTLMNCDQEDQTFLDEIKDLDPAKLAEMEADFQKQLDEATAESEAVVDEFEKLKEEAMATMKKQDELKESLSKLKKEKGYKIKLLQRKLEELKKDEPKKEEL